MLNPTERDTWIEEESKKPRNRRLYGYIVKNDMGSIIEYQRMQGEDPFYFYSPGEMYMIAKKQIDKDEKEGVIPKRMSEHFYATMKKPVDILGRINTRENIRLEDIYNYRGLSYFVYLHVFDKETVLKYDPFIRYCFRRLIILAGIKLARLRKKTGKDYDNVKNEIFTLEININDLRYKSEHSFGMDFTRFAFMMHLPFTRFVEIFVKLSKYQRTESYGFPAWYSNLINSLGRLKTGVVYSLKRIVVKQIIENAKKETYYLENTDYSVLDILSMLTSDLYGDGFDHALMEHFWVLFVCRY